MVPRAKVNPGSAAEDRIFVEFRGETSETLPRFGTAGQGRQIDPCQEAGGGAALLRRIIAESERLTQMASNETAYDPMNSLLWFRP